MNTGDSYRELTTNRKMKILFLVLFFIILLGILAIFRYYFWPFLFALILYMAIRPIHDRLLPVVRSRALCTVLVILILFILIIVPLFYMILNLASQSYQLYGYLNARIGEGLIDEISALAPVKRVMGLLDIGSADIVRKSAELAEKTAVSAFTNLTRVISFQISFFMNFFFMVLMLFFLLKDGHRLDAVFYRILPFPDVMERKVVNRLKEVIRVLLAGNLFIMFCQGLAVGTGFFISGLGMPLLWGSIAAILSLIPVIGTALLWLPAVIYLAAAGSYGSAFFAGIWCLVWYLLLENLVKPRIFGEKLNFHPLVFFFLLLGSIQTFGIPGVIIGPLLLTLFFSFWEIYKFMNEYEKRDTGKSG